MILPDVITLAESAAITSLLWASWTAFGQWRRAKGAASKT
jgi:hypothetical protein